ncbi:MAG: pilus assembly protein N-terminal domain-containing protein [Pseudomonadota bacterium]
MAGMFGKRTQTGNRARKTSSDMVSRIVAGFAAASFVLMATWSGGAVASDVGNGSGTGVVVYKDQAKVFRISRPASTIIVGNPGLLAATVQDLQTIVLTGKAFGTTNMIVLDDAGQPILDEMVIVSQNETSLVRVYSGADVKTLSCAVSACQEAQTTN